MARYIFVTGGVVSSLGKGLSSASLAYLLQSRGYKVRIRKLDPYLNVDPGTMSPFQHGEVFVTDDGAETDLDLGHYERFSGISAKKSDNITTGKIYNDVLKIDENTDIDKLAEDLSIIGSKSVLNGESLPVIDEFDSHTQIVNSALSTAQDLHGRLVASLRNNEIDVAQGLISAIKLNKESEVNFFNKTIDEFNQTYLVVLNEIGELP